MKTIKLLSLFACLFISVNILASEPDARILTNVENTENGSTKVVTSFDEHTSAPLQKISYQYDNNGNILEKVIYKWNDKSGWIGNQKLEYTYNSNNEPITVAFTKWDKKAGSWSEKSEVMTYTYDNGEVSIAKS